MTSFDERQRAFEAKFAHDADLQFRVGARRNKLLGQWAAVLLGKRDAEIEAYVREVVKADFVEAGDDDVLRKVAGDLDGKVAADEVRSKMDALLVEAKAQIAAEG